jgi:hypothetical protein
MAFSFRSIGHFFAVGFKALVGDLPKIEAAKPVVEAITNAIPGGAPFVAIEDVAFSLVGELAAVLTSGGAAAKAKLADAGLDINVLTNVENLLQTAPALVAVAKSIAAKPNA